MTVSVQDNPNRNRYEVHVNGELAGFADYERTTDSLVLTHTEVDEAFEGQGLASELAATVFALASDLGLTVIPQCAFMAQYVADHPELLDLVPVDRRAEFNLA